MISGFDDYCVHQTAEPVAVPAQSDRNFYDRYWFNGYAADGGFMFEAALGLYPNRRVMDAHFSALIEGVQHCFHASRRAPHERGETVVGPLELAVDEPLRRLRLRLTPNPTGIECDLSFGARTVALEEPRSLLYDDGRLVMNTTRFTQFGRWSGRFRVAGREVVLAATGTFGSRDRSWGVRPVGEREGGAPGRVNAAPQVYWIWSPLNFADRCVQFGSFEDAQGAPTQLSAAIVQAHEQPRQIPPDAAGAPGEFEEVPRVAHRVHWRPGTRRAAHAVLELTGHDGQRSEIVLEPRLTFLAKGIGYHHPTWGHGIWHGEEVIAAEAFEPAGLDPLAYENVHVHQLVEAAWGARRGIGTLETLCFGPHAPSGLTGLLDGAPAGAGPASPRSQPSR